MIFSHRIALDPNNVQANYFARAAGVARAAYNWALAEWIRQYDAWKLDNSLPKPSEAALRRLLNSIKREQFPWMMEVTKCAPQMAIKNLGVAFKNFFQGKAAYPQFRKKGRHDSFTVSNDQFKVEGRRIRVPNLGWVRMREELRFKGKILSATFSRVADRWFVSIAVETDDLSHLSKAENQGEVGVDLGIKTMATLSTEKKFECPRCGLEILKKLREKDKRLSRSVSRKKLGSSNWKKAVKKLAKHRARVACIRKDFLHFLTTYITSRFHTIVIENLNVKGMMKNHCLARAIAEMGFYEFRRQLEYKAAMRGCEVIVANRFFPSSKTCSCCGHIFKELKLSMREWTCPACGADHDRDLNAAINLVNAYAASSAVRACEADIVGRARKSRKILSSLKQEASSKSDQK